VLFLFAPLRATCILSPSVIARPCSFGAIGIVSFPDHFTPSMNWFASSILCHDRLYRAFLDFLIRGVKCLLSLLRKSTICFQAIDFPPGRFFPLFLAIQTFPRSPGFQLTRSLMCPPFPFSFLTTDIKRPADFFPSLNFFSAKQQRLRI